MRRIAWADAVRVLGLVVTAFFFVAAVLQAMLAFELTGPAPFGGVDFIDEISRVFVWHNSRWPMEFAATALFALGFTALGGLGVLLARLGESTDARRRLTAAAFIGAGAIGATSQLLWLGVKPIATDPHYCDCGLRAEEIMSRLMILNVSDSIQAWMVIGALVLAAAAVTLSAGLGHEAGMSQAWVWLAWAIAVVSLAAIVLGVLRTFPFHVLAILLNAGILVPIWSLMLAIRAPSLGGGDVAEAPGPAEAPGATAGT